MLCLIPKRDSNPGPELQRPEFYCNMTQETSAICDNDPLREEEQQQIPNADPDPSRYEYGEEIEEMDNLASFADIQRRCGWSPPSFSRR